jgi:SAM-dependent methyltransferase
MSDGAMDFVDLPRPLVIRERHHRIHAPLSEEKLAILGRALRLRPGGRILDLACGSGEMLCTWARDHGVTGTGVDISSAFVAAAAARADELGVGDKVVFQHADASGYVGGPPYDVGACLGASWIGGGVGHDHAPGTQSPRRLEARPAPRWSTGEGPASPTSW